MRKNPPGRDGDYGGDRGPRRLTIASVKAQLHPYGVSLSRTEHDEYRVNFKGGAESTAYYTTTLSDALGTGIYMAERRAGRKNPRRYSRIKTGRRRYRRNPKPHGIVVRWSGYKRYFDLGRHRRVDKRFVEKLLARSLGIPRVTTKVSWERA